MITRWKSIGILVVLMLLAGCSSSSNSGGPVWIFALLAVIGGVGAFLSGRDLLRGRSSTSWPTTQGEVVYSSIEQHMDSDSDGGTSVTYKAKVVYNYQVGGQALVGDRRRFLETSSNNARRAQEAINRYPVGAQVMVYFDPNNPQVSVLEPGAGVGGLIALVITLGLLGFGLYKLVDALLL
jgi:hypothetical protein